MKPAEGSRSARRHTAAPTSARCLIVNADDFGQTHGINQGIVSTVDCGIVTSASLMVRWPAASAAVQLARLRPHLSLGLHIDLGEWMFQDGTWVALYQVVPPEDARTVAEEVERQLAAFRRLTGRDPTHIDSHQHVHRKEPVRSVVLEMAHRLGVPVRHFARDIRHCGAFYGQMAHGEAAPDLISVDHLIHVLETLPPGTTELCCHPGKAIDLTSMYRFERETEIRALCDSRLLTTISELNIRLCSFHDFSTQSEI